MMRKIIFLFLFSFSVFADSVPPTNDTNAYYRLQSYTVSQYNTCYGSTKRCTYQQLSDEFTSFRSESWGGTWFVESFIYQGSAGCTNTNQYYMKIKKSGETMTDTSCNVAVPNYFPPECPLNYTYNSTTQLCDGPPPLECDWPASDNGYGECEIEECLSYELRDSVTGSCFTPPSCAATEFVNLETHECQLSSLRCPLFSHANATNDACLPDPPLACPQGQHDDGTYHCVADDAKACASNEQMGYIDGIPQCIKKVNADQAAADAKTADAAAAAAKAAADAAAATAAQAAADSAAAQAAAAAEPENQALQDAAQAAVQTSLDAAAAATAANTAATEAAAAADLERDKAQTELLKSIEENTSHEGEDPSPASVLDALGGAETETIETTGLANLDDVGLGVTRSCPAPKAYNVMGAQLVIDITAFCDIASIIGNIVMIGAAFFSLRILTMG